MHPLSPTPHPGPARLSALALCVLIAAGLAGCGGGGDQDPDAAGGASTGEAVPTTETWVDFSSDEGRFAVQMPTQPERSQQELSVGDISLTLILFTTMVKDSKAYNVGYVDYPPEITEADPAEVLSGVVQGAAQQVSGTVTSNTPTTANGSPAVDYVVAVQGGQVQARAILVANRLYVVQEATEKPDPDGFGRLVASFELL